MKLEAVERRGSPRLELEETRWGLPVPVAEQKAGDQAV